MNTQERFTGETIPDLIPNKICFGVFSKDDGSNMDLSDAQVMDLHNKLVSYNVQPHMLAGFQGYKCDDGTVQIDHVWRKEKE